MKKRSNVPDIKNLPFVCHDASGSKWHYDVEGDTYYRLYPNNDYCAIKAKYLPDPQKVWDNRVNRMPFADANSIALAKPSEAVYKLYSHSLAVKSKTQ